MADKLLERYDILMNFILNEDKWVKGSTFINENNTICEHLCANGFIQARPQYTTVEIHSNIAEKKKYLVHMNRQELLTTAEEEGVNLYPEGVDLSDDKFTKYWTKMRLEHEIQKKRGKKYVNGRLVSTK